MLGFSIIIVLIKFCGYFADFVWKRGELEQNGAILPWPYEDRTYGWSHCMYGKPHHTYTCSKPQTSERWNCAYKGCTKTICTYVHSTYGEPNRTHSCCYFLLHFFQHYINILYTNSVSISLFSRSVLL